MLTFFGNSRNSHCDGLSRRDFLRIGGLGAGGLALPQLLRAEAGAGNASSHKSVIMIFMTGGPPHQDMYDLKPDAPAEVRGEFQPIATKVPGIQICEHLPRIAAAMDRFVAVRSVVGSDGGHSQFQCTTGYGPTVGLGRDQPSFGSVVSKVQGQVNGNVPPFTSLWYKWSEANPGPGVLGTPHAPFEPKGNDKANMKLGVSLDRLGDRRRLLAAFDEVRREADANARGIDTFREQAFGILTSSQLVNALDLSKEDPRIVQRYGIGDDTQRLPSVPQNFLLARRLVEAGARVVMLNHTTWDWHDKNFTNARKTFPVFDGAITALVEDLHQRGLSDDVTVLAWGEFGRTPKINTNAGRDHWPRVSCALMAGGGMRTGQVIGSTDRIGGEAKDRPVTFQEIFATLYRNLGINLNSATFPDLNGRPRYLVETGVQPMREVM